jgi:peptidoglycan hydrolase-like protein with peptidoglycan-binding domain
MQGVVVPLTQSAPVTYPPPSPFHYTFTAQLDLNATGAEVIALQNALKTDGEFPLTIQSTGFFGTITQTAVKAFQTKYGIEAVGRVGPETLQKLNSLFQA